MVGLTAVSVSGPIIIYHRTVRKMARSSTGYSPRMKKKLMFMRKLVKEGLFDPSIQQYRHHGQEKMAVVR